MPKFSREDLYSDALVLRAGQSAAVEVPFSAAPQPRIRWTFEGLTLNESRRISLDTVYNMASLTITKAQKADAGTYSLHLDNPFGSAHLNVKVIVLGKFTRKKNMQSFLNIFNSATSFYLCFSFKELMLLQVLL